MKDYTRKPKSPYAKYGKRPYLYSDQYQNWRSEVMRARSTDTDDARALDAKWRAAFPATLEWQAGWHPVVL